MKKVFAIILNFNGNGEMSNKCIDSLLKTSHKNHTLTIVVIDNGSKDNSVENIKREHEKDIILIENKINLGFSGGSNTGAEYALKNGADFVMFINNDTVSDRGLIDNLVRRAEPDVIGGVVPKIYFEKGHEFHKERYGKEDLGKVIWYAGGKMDFENLLASNIGVDEVDHGQFDEAYATELATGCCFLIKADVLSKVGLFDDRYFLYYEDADLTERIKKAGYKIYYEPKAMLWHISAASSGIGSELQDYYITRNRLLFGMKYASIRTKIALVRESMNLLRKGRKWQKVAVRDFYLNKSGRGSFKI